MATNQRDTARLRPLSARAANRAQVELETQQALERLDALRLDEREVKRDRALADKNRREIAEKLRQAKYESEFTFTPQIGTPKSEPLEGNSFLARMERDVKLRDQWLEQNTRRDSAWELMPKRGKALELDLMPGPAQAPTETPRSRTGTEVSRPTGASTSTNFSHHMRLLKGESLGLGTDYQLTEQLASKYQLDREVAAHNRSLDHERVQAAKDKKLRLQQEHREAQKALDALIQRENETRSARYAAEQAFLRAVGRRRQAFNPNFTFGPSLVSQRAQAWVPSEGTAG